MGIFASLAGALGGYGEAAERDRVRQDEEARQSLQQLNWWLGSMLNSADPVLKRRIYDIGVKINDPKLSRSKAAEAGQKELSALMFQLGESEQAQGPPANLPEPMPGAPPAVRHDTLPQPAIPPSPQQAVGRFYGAGEEEAEKARQMIPVEQEALKARLGMYQEAGLQPPASLVGQPQQVETVDVTDVPGEVIGEAPGTYWKVRKEVLTGRILVKTQIAGPHVSKPQFTVLSGAGNRPYAIRDQAGNVLTDPAKMPAEGRAAFEAATKASQAEQEEQTQRQIKGFSQQFAMLDARSQAEAERHVRKRVDTWVDAKKRYDLMTSNLNPALQGNLQAQVAILFNHIGMTLSAQTGARITKAEIERAAEARSLPAHLQTMWDQLSKRTILAPEQLMQMVGLGKEVESQARGDVFTLADTLGVDITKVAPGLNRDLGAKGSGLPSTTPEDQLILDGLRKRYAK